MTDDITQICSNCGTNVLNHASSSFKRISKSRMEVIEVAIPFFSARKYTVQAQTDSFVSFESPDRDVDWFILVVFCCLGLIPAVIYYFWFTHNHRITLTFTGTTDVSMNVMGNTVQAKKDAADFMQLF